MLCYPTTAGRSSGDGTQYVPRAGTPAQCRIYPAGGAPRAVSPLWGPRSAPRYSAQAPPGVVATATGRFPPEPRPQKRGCARRGRCGRAGAARRATAVGARRARERAGGRGGARRRAGRPLLPAGPRGKLAKLAEGKAGTGVFGVRSATAD